MKTQSLGASYPATLKSAEISQEGTTLIVSLPEPSGALLDHFPGRVLIPAFAQFDWISWILRQYHSASGIVGVLDAKFLAPLFPPCTVRCEVRTSPEKNLADFTVTTDVLCSKGTVRYA